MHILIYAVQHCVHIVMLQTLGKMTTWLTPLDLASRTASMRPCLQPSRLTPGIEEIGLFFSPSCTKTGRMRFAGDMCVSEKACLTVGLRLFLLGREGKF